MIGYILSKTISSILIGSSSSSSNCSINSSSTTSCFTSSTFISETTIVQLVEFAGELVNDEKNANKLGITGRERAFYDALVRDKSAKELLIYRYLGHRSKEQANL